MIHGDITLYPHQVEGSSHLAEAVKNYNAALDASDTGVGKTFTALAASLLIGERPLIICPKIIKSAWRDAAAAMGVEPIDICNIEQLKVGKTPYLKKPSKNTFIWQLPRGSLIIWDEVQNAGGYKSQNGAILALTRVYGINTLCLSATAADSPLKLRSLGFLLGLHHYRDAYTWCMNNGCYPGSHGGIEFPKGPARMAHLLKIHGQIFPNRGFRARAKDLDTFPECLILAEAYDLGKYTKEINDIYDEMSDELQDPERAGEQLTVMLRARQRTELFKVPLLIDMAKDIYEEERSIVIFVSFSDTLDQLIEGCRKICKVSVIRGGQKEADRDEAIRAFQADENRICVAMIQAGGVGVSLHDLNGNYPRSTLITPSFSAVHMKQALGRVHRAGGKTKSIQKILFAADTVEEAACKAISRKLANISLLNDGDLTEGIGYDPDE